MSDTTLDVIAVGAHPDDVEIACGGTIAKLAALGYRVGIIDLTNGEPTPRCDDPAIRLKEAERAAEVLGVAVRKVLDLPNRRLFDSFEARVALAAEFRRYRPRLVLGFGQKTPLASPDHYQAMLITDAAVFYSRLTKWDEHFPGLPVHTIPRQLYFQLGFEHTTTPGPSITVNITGFLEKKIEAVLCYQTQFPPERKQVLDRVRAIAMTTGLAAGFEAGEEFRSPRTIGCEDLVKAVIPEGE